MQDTLSFRPNTILAAVGLFFLVWLYLQQGTLPVSDVRHVSVDEAAALIEAGALVIDVREKEAYDKKHLPGALLIPLGEIEKRLNEIYAAGAEEIIVYCGDGSTRGPVATRKLNNAGLTNARNLRGGVQGWGKAGLQLATG